MSMFREYDIRGVVGQDLTDGMIEKIGKAIGTTINGTVLVGNDNRTHSGHVKKIFISALASTGCDAVELGTVTSPMLYFASRTLDSKGSVMITASHNPKEYNGFKVIKDGRPLYGEDIYAIGRLAESGKFSHGQGNITQNNIENEYYNYITSKVNIKKGISIVLDCGNGTTALFSPQILENLGCSLIKLYCESDGNFPNHEPDPVVEKNLKEMIAKVKEEKADIGIGFDGDGDRLGIVDEKGNIIPGDKILIILSRDLLKRKNNEKIIYEVKCSMTLEEDIRKNQGIPIMYKTGHSLIKAKMKEEDASLAGEMSGHFFFKELGFFDDALYAACRIMEIMSETGKTVSQLLEGVPKTYATPEIREDCPDELKMKVIGELQKRLMKYNPLTIDGVRVNFPDGWGLVRASNTQPALVLRFEALDENRLQEIKSLIEAEVKDAKCNICA